MVFNSILVVCVGNICRSPTGAAMLRNLFPDKKISSAGISAVVGHDVDPMARRVAELHGLSIEPHSAQQLTSSICYEFDLILVMEKKHIEAVSEISQSSRGKTMLFAHWLDKRDIDDPYRKSQEAFEHVYQLMFQSAEKWAKLLGS